MALELPTTARVLFQAQLRPLQGTRFQPTGFPDIGASTYRLPDGTEMLIVESQQSIANRLEAVCWDEAKDDLVPELAGMPYVRVEQNGSFLTSSILEAHRLNSVYIEKSDAFEKIRQAIGHEEKRPVDRKRFVRALFQLDPSSLLHGVFLESIDGRLRVERVVSGSIEARGASVVSTGGVKIDRVSASGGDDAGAAQGYGNVPFHRDEFVANEIVAYFNIDVAQLRSFGLPELASRFLFALALWKISAFFETGLRLRTACDLDVIRVEAIRPDGFRLPARAELMAALRELIPMLAKEGLFASPPVTIASYDDKKSAERKAKGKR